MEAFLVEFLPRHLDAVVEWRAIDYGSKQQLLHRLPSRMKGYSRIPPDSRPKSLVLVDRDDDDCLVLKARLEAACAEAGLSTVTMDRNSFEVVNRIACEELEAWFFGDAAALDAVFRGVGKVTRQAVYRDPDAIRGGTHEALLREVQRSGHLKGTARLPKIDTARTMGRMLDPERNTSRSFQHFWSGLRFLAAIA